MVSLDDGYVESGDRVCPRFDFGYVECRSIPEAVDGKDVSKCRFIFISADDRELPLVIEDASLDYRREIRDVIEVEVREQNGVDGLYGTRQLRQSLEDAVACVDQQRSVISFEENPSLKRSCSGILSRR